MMLTRHLRETPSQPWLGPLGENGNASTATAGRPGDGRSNVANVDRSIKQARVTRRGKAQNRAAPPVARQPLVYTMMQPAAPRPGCRPDLPVSCLGKISPLFPSRGFSFCCLWPPVLASFSGRELGEGR